MGRAMLSKYLIQFSVEGWGCVPSLLFDLRQIMKIMATSFKRSHARAAILSAPSPAAGHRRPTPPQRLLDTHGQVWVSLFWGHFSFLLGPDVHKVLFVPSKSLFPQSCVSSGGSVVGLMATSSKRAYARPGLLHPEPLPHSSPLLTRTSSGGTQTQFCLSLCGVSGSWCAQGMFKPSEHLWQI